MIDLPDNVPADGGGGAPTYRNPANAAQFDAFALPDGMMSSVEHFKMLVRRVQSDAGFREKIEEYARARRDINRQAGISDVDSGVPVWLVAARNPEKYRAVLRRLEAVQAMAEQTILRRVQAERMQATSGIHAQVQREIGEQV